MNQKQYKEFYKFVSILNNDLVQLFEEQLNRPNPCKGDKYLLIHQYASRQALIIDQPLVFDCIEYDSEFKYGVAFFYVFDNQYGEKTKIWSINEVSDIEGFIKDPNHKDMIPFVYGFWRNLIQFKN